MDVSIGGIIETDSTSGANLVHRSLPVSPALEVDGSSRAVLGRIILFPTAKIVIDLSV